MVFSPYLGRNPDHSALAILQGSHSLEYTIPSERLETCWGSGEHGERAICHSFGVDDPWKHHGLHQREVR